MKHIKKNMATAFVVAALFVGGQSVAALENNQSIAQRIATITQLVNLSEEYPQLAPLLRPALQEAVVALVTEIQNGALQQKPKADYHKKEIKKTVKPYVKKTDVIDYATKNIKKITTQPYENIKNKWQVDVHFENGKTMRFYVYDIENMSELADEIKNLIEEKFDIEISDMIDDILDIQQTD